MGHLREPGESFDDRAPVRRVEPIDQPGEHGAPGVGQLLRTLAAQGGE
jgi:hypothetical protein